MDTGEKLIIASAITKDVYICPCISLIRHHMQYIGVKSGLFTSILVVKNVVFLIITGDWKGFVCQNEKFLDFAHPCNLLEYFQNKESDSNKTL